MVTIRLRNPTRQIAFFERAELTATRDGDEILPIRVQRQLRHRLPGETVEIRGTALDPSAAAGWVRVSGYNTAPVPVPVR